MLSTSARAGAGGGELSADIRKVRTAVSLNETHSSFRLQNSNCRLVKCMHPPWVSHTRGAAAIVASILPQTTAAIVCITCCEQRVSCCEQLVRHHVGRDDCLQV